ncbi:YggS family pyridoxal phosphate-dependent enzyme [soil metagenome]
MGGVFERMQATMERLGRATQQAGREPSSVQLLAVSKTFPPEAVLDAVRAGARHFGENYVQEGVDKIVRVDERLRREFDHAAPIVWHFIGPIQSNKTRDIAAAFDWVQSVDRARIAERLSAQRPPGRPALQICLQVNISGEASKSGVTPEAGALLALALEVVKLPNLCLRGVMGIPAFEDDPARQRPPLAALARLHRGLADAPELAAARGEGRCLIDTLSMGMSDDLEAAVLEGATQVRIGTAIFGARQARISAPPTAAAS